MSASFQGQAKDCAPVHLTLSGFSAARDEVMQDPRHHCDLASGGHAVLLGFLRMRAYLTAASLK